ncbi:MAG: N-formylglutamate amidohydrolase [Fimbriimonadaceae bacterium]|nr:N-formylglutamate amidohydrolase [Alphaproteobacteria bacterium]
MLNKTSTPPPILSGFEPLERISGDDRSGLLLLGDHANKELPGEYGSLGLPESEFLRHIASDIGTRSLVIALAERLGSPAIMTRFSRLLIDPNRGEDDPTLIMKISDRAVVPGNLEIDDAEREKRLNNYYRPYHRAVTGQLDLMMESGRIPVILSVHSFTHSWRGMSRPWHAGVLWDRDPRFAVPIIDGLRQQKGLEIGDNEPYKGSLRGDTMYRHGTKRGLAHALIEVRQDLISSDEGIEEWAERLARLVREIIDAAELHLVKQYGSIADDGLLMPA